MPKLLFVTFFTLMRIAMRCQQNTIQQWHAQKNFYFSHQSNQLVLIYPDKYVGPLLNPHFNDTKYPQIIAKICLKITRSFAYACVWEGFDFVLQNRKWNKATQTTEKVLLQHVSAATI